MVWRWPWATEEWRWRLCDNAGKIGKNWETRYICNWMSFTWLFLSGPAIFRTNFPCSGGLSPGDWWNAITWCIWDKLWKGRNYWKSRRRCEVYGLRGVCWWLCVHYLTWHDYPSLMEGEVVVYYYNVYWQIYRPFCNQLFYVSCILHLPPWSQLVSLEVSLLSNSTASRSYRRIR